MPPLELLLVNATGRARREFFQGRWHLVVPLRLIVPGVLNGSAGPLLYPPEEVAANPGAWNGMPTVLGHPTDGSGQFTSARQPHILQRLGMGALYNARINPGAGGALDADGYFDEQRTREVDGRVYDALISGRQLELSTGLFTRNDPAPPDAVFNGRDRTGRPYSRPYSYVARAYRPDHLAVLLDARGACSVDDGCGVNVNQRQQGSSTPRVVEANCGGPGSGKPGPCPVGTADEHSGSTHPAVERVLARLTHVQRPDQVYQASLDQWFNDSQARKDFTDKGKDKGRVRFASAVQAEFEKRMGARANASATTEPVSNAWSDAARAASAAARAAKAANPAAAKAHAASDRALAASKEAGRMRTGAAHEDASTAHETAAAAHGQAKVRAQAAGNDKGAAAHADAYHAHKDAQQAHYRSSRNVSNSEVGTKGETSPMRIANMGWFERLLDWVANRDPLPPGNGAGIGAANRGDVHATEPTAPAVAPEATGDEIGAEEIKDRLAANQIDPEYACELIDRYGDNLDDQTRSDLEELCALANNASAAGNAAGDGGAPSEGLDMTPEKACQILKDGTVQGHELTPAQRGMFGALCGQRDRGAKNVSSTDESLSSNAFKSDAERRAAFAAMADAGTLMSEKALKATKDANRRGTKEAHRNAARAHSQAANYHAKGGRSDLVEAHTNAAKEHSKVSRQVGNASGAGADDAGVNDNSGCGCVEPTANSPGHDCGCGGNAPPVIPEEATLTPRQWDMGKEAQVANGVPGWAVPELWAAAEAYADGKLAGVGKFKDETYWATVANIYQQAGGTVGEMDAPAPIPNAAPGQPRRPDGKWDSPRTRQGSLDHAAREGARYLGEPDSRAHPSPPEENHGSDPLAPPPERKDRPEDEEEQRKHSPAAAFTLPAHNQGLTGGILAAAGAGPPTITVTDPRGEPMSHLRYSDAQRSQMVANLRADNYSPAWVPWRKDPVGLVNLGDDLLAAYEGMRKDFMVAAHGAGQAAGQVPGYQQGQQPAAPAANANPFALPQQAGGYALSPQQGAGYAPSAPPPAVVINTPTRPKTEEEWYQLAPTPMALAKVKWAEEAQARAKQVAMEQLLANVEGDLRNQLAQHYMSMDLGALQLMAASQVGRGQPAPTQAGIPPLPMPFGQQVQQPQPVANFTGLMGSTPMTNYDVGEAPLTSPVYNFEPPTRGGRAAAGAKA